MLLATHPAGSSRPPIGKAREGTVYEPCFTTLPSPAFTPADVLDLYLHPGSFETVLANEEEEQAVDRWVSRTPWGQECWPSITQWMWNRRLELGPQAQATTMRVTDLAYSLVQNPSTPPPAATTAPVDPAPSSAAPEPTGSAEPSQNALN